MFSALWRRKSFLVFSFYSCSAFLLKFMGVILIKSFLTSALPEKLMIEIQIAAAPRWRSSQSRLSRSPLSPPTLSPPCSSQMLPWWTWAMSPDSLPSSTILESVKALTWPIMWSCTTTPMLTLLFHWGKEYSPSPEYFVLGKQYCVFIWNVHVAEEVGEKQERFAPAVPSFPPPGSSSHRWLPGFCVSVCARDVRLQATWIFPSSVGRWRHKLLLVSVEANTALWILYWAIWSKPAH